MKLTRSHDSYMKEVLANREEASAYLNAAIADGELKYLLVAIRRVVAANGGMGKLAKTVKMSRTSLYKALSSAGNPSFATLEAVLAVYGIRLGCFPIQSPRQQHRHATSHGHYIIPHTPPHTH